MKRYYECTICEKLLKEKEVDSAINNNKYYCKKCWEGYFGISKIAVPTGRGK